MTYQPSARAQIIARRTYSRPLNEEGTLFETWEQTIDRVIMHQQWLWERANNDKPLSNAAHDELKALKLLMMERKSTVSGRTLWLGGTQVAKRRMASQFNCSFLRITNIHDVVDAMWMLLQGCGVGFEPIVGTLNGFTKPATVDVIRSQRHLLSEPRGRETNIESIVDGVWTLSIGDSAEAWAKAVGKIMAQKAPFEKVVLDFQQIRPAGYRLKGYGWISSGDEMFCKALVKICEIMSRKAGQLLTRIDILDICNWLGTTLSSRRSAQIALVPYGDPEWREFATAKKDYYIDNPQRGQSNNSLMFFTRPSKHDLSDIFQMMVDAGGSEPGFANGEAALARAPWFKGGNPCYEILLGDNGICNLCETDLSKFNGKPKELDNAIYVISRANYRQTCVDLRDGILQNNWHELNQFLRLCGVGVTGVVGWEGQHSPEAWRRIRAVAKNGCDDMADELKLPRSKAITTCKPSGTLSKIMDCTEGLHKPLGSRIFNNVRFSKHDPILASLTAAGYYLFDDPYASDGMLVRFPVEWNNVDFDKDESGKDVNKESAIKQMNRYKMLMDNYVDHNASITVSYSVDEVPDMVKWIYKNWDSYVGMSFLFRNDPSKTAADLGYEYLPQEVVTEGVYQDYVKNILPINLDTANKSKGKVDQSDFEVDAGSECAGGVCPIK